MTTERVTPLSDLDLRRSSFLLQGGVQKWLVPHRASLARRNVEVLAPGGDRARDLQGAPGFRSRHSRPEPHDVGVRQDHSSLQVLRIDGDAAVSLALQLLPDYALGQAHDWMNEIYPLWVAARGILLVTPVNWSQAPARSRP